MYCTIEINRNLYMKPDENSSSNGGKQLLPKRLMVSVPNQQTDEPSREAAARVIRSKIDTLFDQKSNSDSEQKPTNTSTPVEDINPYQRTHSEHVMPQDDQWKQYHTAWQNYYQQYYEGYYTHHLRKAQQAIEEQIAGQQNAGNSGYFNKKPTDKSTPDKVVSTKEAVFDLRQELRNKVQDSVKKIKKSRHFIPIAAGLMVVLLFLFLQYNRILISNVMAYVSPGNIDPQNIVIDPNVDLKVGPEPRLIIPKINVDVPVRYDVGSDYDSQMAAMNNGVAHFSIPGASSHPGQVGNTVIAGHSSSDLFGSGDYKFIFVQLEKLDVGDTIYANYNSKRYTYTVTKKEVVKPTEVNKLVYPTTKPVMTLLTCTPLGTAINRLLIIAEQISPDPSQSATAPAAEPTSKLDNSAIPGNSQTFFEWLFGIKN